LRVIQLPGFSGNCGNWQLECSNINGLRQLPDATPVSASIWNLSIKNNDLGVNFQMPANSPLRGRECTPLSCTLSDPGGGAFRSEGACHP
jgi:hypothetical protein